MVSSNKILTVSYGTFSCTLEGFDNSFDTMKAIAEYFRDLAQDDRYFGAEPPTPDAEMLARIAEREIARRVEARFEKGNLVLRPSDESAPPRGDVAPEPSAAAGPVGAAAGLAASSPAVANTPQPQNLAETGLDHTALLAETEAEDEDGDYGVTPLMVEDDPSEDMFLDDEDVEDDYDEPLSDFDDEDDADISDVEPVAERQAVAADSVSDKLQRIRAVVANKAPAEPEYIEDEHAMSGPDGDGNDENDALEPVAEMPELADTARGMDETVSEADDEDEGFAADDNLFTDTIAAIVSDQIDIEDDEEDAFLPELSDDSDDEDDEDDEDDFADDPQSEINALRARIAQLEARAAKTPEPEVDAIDDDDDEDLDDDDAPLVLSGADDEDDTDLSFEDDEDDEIAAAPAPLVARVGKIKRSEVEAAIAAGTLEEYEDEDDEEPVARSARSDSGKLTPEEEAKLARELAELQDELDDDDDWDFDIPEAARSRDAEEDDEDDERADDTAADTEMDDAYTESSIRKAVKLTSPARAMLTETTIEEDDDSVDRLIDQAETEMDEPEGNRRRSAIAHLRAAVAATKADRLLGLGKKKSDEEEPYREDLADAVRPRRPKITQTRSERPAPVRPAPLKLVAEQRVDVAPADAAPVRPRRVIRSVDSVDLQDDTAAGEDNGFAEFAEKVGAHSLPELLEAAAAYMSFVEGRDQFSRPQLMTKLHQAEGEASSREERLRSFGQLLREGKIEKTGGGRFTASDNIGYRPDKRAAG